MQKIKIKSTILVAILIAIFSTIMCMGFVSAEELPSDSIGENIPDLIGGIAKNINYYDKSGALIKTESLLAGNNMTGIEGYEGNYIVRTDNYDEVSQWMTFIVPSFETVSKTFVLNHNRYELLNNDYDYSKFVASVGSTATTPKSKSFQMFQIIDSDYFYAHSLNLENYFNTNSSKYFYFDISKNNGDSVPFWATTNDYAGADLNFECADMDGYPGMRYSDVIGDSITITNVYNRPNNSMDDVVETVYLNETMSLDELSALNMDNVMSDTINVYTDIEAAQKPEAPTDEPTDEPSGDENGDIILPPSDKPSDTDKPSDGEPIKEQSKLDKSNAELKAQWTALLAHDWQNAQGWQLITLMIVTLAVVIAIIVTIPVVCHQIKKANNVKRIKARSVARKR